MPNQIKLIPIYTSHGNAAGFLSYPYIYNLEGEWIGWVTNERVVYSVHGHYVGTLGQGPRILRQRESAYDRERRQPPPPPPEIHPPIHIPLAPPMAEVAINMIDVLEEAPELLPPVDFGDLRQDMD
jgi:hypothetical protein